MAKKKNPRVTHLEALYKNEPGVRRWEEDGEPSYYERSLAGRRVCRLSAEATAFILQNHVGRNHKSGTLILIEPEGDIRLGGMQVFEDWYLALKVCLDEGTYMYNARTKRCSRPVWVADPEDRTFANMTFETVRLIPDQKTYDDKLPRVNAVIFAED